MPNNDLKPGGSPPPPHKPEHAKAAALAKKPDKQDSQTLKDIKIIYRRQRRERQSVFRLLGSVFYTLGFNAEYYAMRFWRVLRDGGIFFGQIFLWLFGGVAGWLGDLFRGIGRDLTAPLRRFSKRRRQLRRIRERARHRQGAPGAATAVPYTRARLKTLMQLALTLVSYLLPAAAAGVLVFTVYNVVTMNYALRVEINGVELGFVADQSVVEGAKGLLRDRIRLARNQELSDWQLEANYSLAYARELTTTQELVDEILINSTSENDIVRATGVRVNGELFGVTTDGERLQDFLDSQLALVEAEAPDGAKVDFVRDVECDPPNEYAYFLSSVEDYDQLIGRLGRNVSEARTVTANGEAAIADIAHQNDITLDTLRLRNPELAAQPDDYVPEAGTALLLQNAEPFLQVETNIRVQKTEEIPYERVEQPTEEHAIGVERVVQEGVPGQREVWDDEFYVDGELVRSERVEELTRVLQEPVEEVVEVGTYDFSDVPTGEFGAYYFPVPASTWSSRGVGGHRGMDINAPTGTPVFACNEGVVEAAGWHWSYGWHVIIRHQDGLTTLYGHLSSYAVEAGQHVMRSQYIGAVGSTGVSTGPHLHLEFYYESNTPLDPLDYVAPPEGYRMDWLRWRR